MSTGEKNIYLSFQTDLSSKNTRFFWGENGGQTGYFEDMT